MIKKGVSLLMALALCLTLLPASALAAEAQGQAGQEQTVLTQGNDGQTQAPGQDGAGEDDKTSDEAPDKAPASTRIPAPSTATATRSVCGWMAGDRPCSAMSARTRS